MISQAGSGRKICLTLLLFNADPACFKEAAYKNFKKRRIVDILRTMKGMMKEETLNAFVERRDYNRRIAWGGKT